MPQTTLTNYSFSLMYQHPSTVDTRQETKTAHAVGLLSTMSLFFSLMSPVYVTSVFNVTCLCYFPLAAARQKVRAYKYFNSLLMKY